MQNKLVSVRLDAIESEEDINIICMRMYVCTYIHAQYTVCYSKIWSTLCSPSECRVLCIINVLVNISLI